MAGRLRWLNRMTMLVFDQLTNTMVPLQTIGGVVPVTPSGVSVTGYQQIIGLAAATALTLPTSPQLPAQILVVAETQGVRWRADGTNPTASVGQPLYPGQELILSGKPNGLENAITDVRFIEMVASAILNITYFGN